MDAGVKGLWWAVLVHRLIDHSYCTSMSSSILESRVHVHVRHTVCEQAISRTMKHASVNTTRSHDLPNITHTCTSAMRPFRIFVPSLISIVRSHPPARPLARRTTVLSPVTGGAVAGAGVIIAVAHTTAVLGAVFIASWHWLGGHRYLIERFNIKVYLALFIQGLGHAFKKLQCEGEIRHHFLIRQWRLNKF